MIKNIHFTTRCAIIFLLRYFWLHEVYAQYGSTPSIACPDIFQYVNHDGQYIGKITLSVTPGTTVVDVELSQQYPVRSVCISK